MLDFGMALLIVFAVLGVCAFVFCLLEWLFRPKGRLPLILPAPTGDPKSLLGYCDHVGWLRRMGVDVHLCIVEEGLDPESLDMISRLAANDGKGIELWKAEDLNTYVTRNFGGTNPLGRL